MVACRYDTITRPPHTVHMSTPRHAMPCHAMPCHATRHAARNRRLLRRSSQPPHATRSTQHATCNNIPQPQRTTHDPHDSHAARHTPHAAPHTPPATRHPPPHLAGKLSHRHDQKSSRLQLVKVSAAISLHPVPIREANRASDVYGVGEQWKAVLKGKTKAMPYDAPPCGE